MVSVKKYNTVVEKYNKLHKEVEKEKLKKKMENYQSPYMISQHSKQLKTTCHPMTPHVTQSFEMAREIRTPYDKYWLKIYNSHSLNENYNLP